MSHFAVAVFTEEGGKTVEELLAPFNENIEMDRYVAFTKEELIEKGRGKIKEYATKGSYAEYIKDPFAYEANHSNQAHLDYLKNEFPQKLEWTNEEVYQDEIKWYEEDEIGENGEVYSTYNPNSKWDWYQIGGRWSGLLKLRDGATGSMGERSWTNEDDIISANMVDSAKLKDIDFSMDEKEYKRKLRFWELKVEEQQPLNEQEEEMIEWDFYKKEYYIERYDSKEEFARLSSEFSTYAVITPDGKWHSKGEMGWFGCSSETGDEAKLWSKSYYDSFIKNANPDHTLTIVDCHI